MSQPPTLLRTAYEAMKREYDRIAELMPLEKEIQENVEALQKLPKPLRSEVSLIRRVFNDTRVRASNLLSRIDSAEKQQELKEGWELYAELKSQVMPVLSNELLAVIGGIYLKDVHLDYLHYLRKADDDQSVRQRGFTEQAEQLIKNLADRSGMGWQSALIVGEERFSYSKANIIRLRFPACDLWNLPFTAHEYGYIVAYKDEPDWLDFPKLRKEVWDSFDLANSNWERPQYQKCYLKDVDQLWNEFSKLSKNRRKETYEQRKAEIDALREKQVAYVCRLFADAFATFFVGPAYVYALIYLRFVPDDSLYRPSPEMPPFIVRFVTALETLRWMDREPALARYFPEGPNVTPFNKQGKGSEDLTEPDSLFALWHRTIKGIAYPKELSSSPTAHDAEPVDEKISQQYEDMKESYAYWLCKIRRALINDFIQAVDVKPYVGTFHIWQEAMKLAEKELSELPQVQSPDNPWGVLSAAWLARHRNPDPKKVKSFEDNALQLFVRLASDQKKVNEDDLQKSEAVAPRGATPTYSEDRLQQTPLEAIQSDITLVRATLAGGQVDLVDIFISMVSKNRFEQNSSIQIYLNSTNQDALLAFIRLVKYTQGGGDTYA
jgi:hypothetical protein